MCRSGDVFGGKKLARHFDYLQLSGEMGFDEPSAQKINNDYDALWEYTDLGQGRVRSQFHSKYLPFENIFASGTPFQYEYLGETWQVIESLKY